MRKSGFLFLFAGFLFTGVLLCAVRVAAQEGKAAMSGGSAQAVRTVGGRIIDKQSKEPVSYADITVVNTSISTISNEEGRFVLKIPAGYEQASVKVSHIGYSTAQLSLPGLDSTKGLVALTINPSVLDEVVIRPLDPLALIKGAVANIPKNYSAVPLQMKGFYREIVMEQNRTVQLSEALLGIYFSPYGEKKAESGIKLLKGRRGKDPDSSVFFSGNGNINGVLEGVVNADLAHRVGEEFKWDEFMKYSNMKVMGIMDFDDLQVYEIHFDEKDHVKKPLYEGRIFLDTRSLAIVSIEYRLSPKGIEYYELMHGLNRTMAALNKVDFSLRGSHVTVNYKRIGSTWYLSDAIADYQIHFGRPGKGKTPAVDEIINISSELLVSAIDAKNAVPFEKSELVSHTGGLYQKIKDYDPDYWEHNNFIVPTERIRKIADKLKDQQ